MVTGAGPETNGLPGLTRGRCRHLHDDHQVSTLRATGDHSSMYLSQWPGTGARGKGVKDSFSPQS